MQKTKILATIWMAAFLTVFPVTAQDYDWAWAERGGGTNDMTNFTPSYYSQYEKVNAIAVDGHNNYYFVAEVGRGTVTYGDEDITTYNGPYGGSDIYIFSTDCQGAFRWDKTIGGHSRDLSRSIAVDALGGVYVAGKVSPNPNNGTIPVHYDTDSIKGPSQNAPDPDNKSMFLIKYDTMGNYQWLREPENDNVSDQGNASSVQISVEPDGTIHWLVWLGEGGYLNDEIIVPEGETKLVILKYDKDGNFLGHIELPYKYPGGFYSGHFHYDPLNQQYYLAVEGDGDEEWIRPWSVDGVDVEGGMVLTAFDDQGNVLWWHENNTFETGIHLDDVFTDENSNVYVTGLTNSGDPENSGEVGNNSFGGYIFDQVQGSGDGFGTNAPFLIKFDAQGGLIWGTNADTYNRPPGRSIAIHGGEVILGLGLQGDNSWDGITLGNEGALGEATIIRFDKETGEVIAIHGIEGPPGGKDEITAIAVDLHGNYVVGGFTGENLFADHPVVPAIYNSGGASDFFVAQLSHTDCTAPPPMGVAEERKRVRPKVYPNPAHDRLYLEDGAAIWKKYRLYSLLGQAVSSGRLLGNGQGISLEGLPPGLYLLELEDGEEGTAVVKVVKE